MEYEEKEIWMQELQDAGATQLLSWDRKEIFEAPPPYFNEFEGTLADRLTDEMAVGDSFILALLDKKEPFQAPEGYFPSFQQRIQDKIKQENSNPIRVINPAPSWRLASVAAAILVFIVGSWLIFSPNNSTPQLNEAEIMAFIDAENIDAYTLAEVFDISDISIHDATHLSEDDIQEFLDTGNFNEWDLENILDEEI